MTDTVIVAIIGFLGICVTSFFAYRASKSTNNKIAQIHVLINSRMSELLKASELKSRAEGNLEGRKEQREEGKDKK